MSVRPLALLATFLCSFVVLSAAQDPPTPPSVSEERAADTKKIEAAIAALQGAKTLDPKIRDAALNNYRSALAKLKSCAAFEKAAAKYGDAIEKTPKEVASIRERLNKQDGAFDTKVTVEPDESSKAIDQRLVAVRVRVANLQSDVSRVDNDIRQQRDRPDQIQDELAKARGTLDESKKSSAEAPPVGQDEAVTASLRALRDAREKALVAQIGQLEQERTSHGVRLEGLTARRDLAAAELKAVKTQETKLEKAVGARRAKEAEAAKMTAEDAIRGLADAFPWIAGEANENKSLADDQARLEAWLVDARKNVKETERVLKLIRSFRTATERRLAVAQRSVQMGQWLQRELQRIPQLKKALPQARALETSFLDLAVQELEAEEDLTACRDVTAVVKRILTARQPEIKAFVSPTGGAVARQRQRALEDTLTNLITSRRALLTMILSLYQDVHGELKTVETKHEEAVTAIDDYQAMLSDRLIWMPSGKRIAFGTFARAWGGAKVLAEAGKWTAVGNALADSYRSSNALVLAILIFSVGLIIARPRITRAIRDSSRFVGDPARDAIHYTLRALFLSLLTAIPEPALLFTAAWFLKGGEPFAVAFGLALEQVAIQLTILRFWIVCFRPEGVAIRHFKWDPDMILPIHRRLIKYAILALPLTLVVLLAHNARLESSLGQLAFLGLVGLFSWLLLPMLYPRQKVLDRSFAEANDNILSRSRHVWFPLFVAAVVAVATISALGYHHASMVCARPVGRTVWIVLIGFFAHAFLIRWIVLARRRIAHRRAEADPAETPETGDAESLPPPKPEELDIRSIDDQTRSVVRVVIALLMIVQIWSIWSGVLPVLSNITDTGLWSYAAAITGDPDIPFTLGDAFIVLVIIVCTIAAARNIPGFLEIVILRRLALDPGARYAISTLTRYALTTAGILLTVSALGFRWAQLQWLIAAMGVGLGFGLQEIVANFVCGLIIFFERRIRIGDVVTVDQISGDVTRIKILATTVTDWDRKEYIVPNKEFITGRLLNWTLSDAVNRIVLKIKVAYGTDTKLARSLLVRVAHENPNILSEPAPFATFEHIGESYLELTLRCYLPDVNNRLSTQTSLHEDILRTFKEAGIRVPFPQRAIHIRSMGPEAQLDESAKEAAFDEKIGRMPPTQPDA